MTTPYFPLLELTPNRVLAAVRRLEALVWPSAEPVEVFATEASAEPVSLENARHLPLRRVRPGSSWGKLYDQRWCRLELPGRRGASAAPRYLEWRDQGEATLHVDGLPFYGFDVAHRRVALPQGAKKLWVESWCCQSAIWHPKATGLSPSGSVFEGAFLVGRDDLAWNTFHDLQCLADLMVHLRAAQAGGPVPDIAAVGPQPSVARVTPLYRRVLRLLDEAVDVFDRDGLAALQRSLRTAMAELHTERPLVRAVLTGHAHIDLVWLWPERVGEAKAVHTFATVNRLMSLYPEFRFAYSQPASYQAVARLQPRLHRAVLERLRERRWEPTGAMQVESDTQLPCGEALARSFVLGQEAFRELRGNPARLCWLPDVFGYSACLPQLMRLVGVPWFFTTKLTWSAMNRFPFSSFVWRGNDGSEVVAHVTQDCGYNNLVDLPRLHAGADGHGQSDVHPEYLHPTGYGDGGGGPTEEMCERARRLSSLGDTPEIVWDQPEAFFERLDRLRSRLPVFQGECYLEYHRGTYTTHSAVKEAYRRAERALQVREAVACALGTAADLRAPWRRVVFTQFHDCLPGSSVPEVYAETLPELRRIEAEHLSAAASELNRADAKTTEAVFNPLPLPWQGWVRKTRTASPVWLEILPLSSAPLVAAPQSPAPARASRRTLDNGLVRAGFDGHGRLRSLELRGQSVPFSGPAAVPVLYSDTPAAYEAWDIDRNALATGKPAFATAPTVEVREETDRAVLVVSGKIGRDSTLDLRFVLVAGESVLRIEADLDWHERNTLLKLHFPTRYQGRQARFGAPFGSVLRVQQPGTAAAEAQWEVPASRWAAIADDGEREGLALISEAKFGFAARDGDLSVSLVRGARVVGFDNHDKAAPRVLSRLAGADAFSDQGHHRIRLALAAHDLGAPRREQPAALADLLFCEPLPCSGKGLTAGLLAIDGGESLIPAWAMPVAPGVWVLRLHETCGQRGYATMRLAEGWTATPCSLDGTPLRRSTTTRVHFRPYEIVSLRISKRSR
ncbi:alpha-mannosidase [Opitutaceae bacterium EW11]|nr:alpha-mannosidase [Opitutaceae bacterium EW11]